MSINITVASANSGSFSATAVTTDNTTVTVGSNVAADVTLTVDGGIGPPGVGNVAIAPGTGIAITTVSNVSTISSTVQGVPASNLADLADVDATAPTSGQVLEWNGTAWAPGLDSTLTLASTGGSDLGASTAGTSSEAARADHAHNLPALADLVGVSLGTPSSGQVLAYNGTAWAPAADNALTLSADAGADLGAAAAGSAGVAARADHVHNLPTFAEITNGTATVTGNLTLHASTGSVIVNGGSGAGSLTLNCEQNTHGVTIASPAHSAGASYTLTLPATAGSANQVLTTDGTGSLSWSNGTSSGSGGGISWTTPAPGNSSDAGTAGAVAYSGQFFFLHNGTQWNRVQLAGFGTLPADNLLTEGGDTLATEAGNQLAYDGLGSYPGGGGGGSATLTFSSQPSSQEITATAVSTTVTFNATATHSDGDAVSYQWQELPSGGSWANLSGETYDNLSLTAYQGTSRRQYRVVATSGALQETSSAATLTMHTEVNNGQQYVADLGSGYWPMQPTYHATGTFANTTTLPYVTATDTTSISTAVDYYNCIFHYMEVFKDGTSVASNYNSTGLSGFYWDGSAYQFLPANQQFASSSPLPTGEYRLQAKVKYNSAEYSESISTHPFDA